MEIKYNADGTPQKRRGRPPGSKNKVKSKTTKPARLSKKAKAAQAKEPLVFEDGKVKYKNTGKSVSARETKPVRRRVPKQETEEVPLGEATFWKNKYKKLLEASQFFWGILDIEYKIEQFELSRKIVVKVKDEYSDYHWSPRCDPVKIFEERMEDIEVFDKEMGLCL